jgi:hypothetical protein
MAMEIENGLGGGVLVIKVPGRLVQQQKIVMDEGFALLVHQKN